MNHSYEGLQRIGDRDRAGLLRPLRCPAYRLTLGGLIVSLAGDGVFLIALAWQVYALSDVPTALAGVGIAMTVPTIVCLLIGGAVADRTDPRRVMLVADVVRALTLATLASLSMTGSLTLAELLVIAVVHGAATAFFDPASDALVPRLLEAESLAAANALDQIVRPLALRLAGPALGGVAIAVVGTGGAFATDAGSFAVSAAALLAIPAGSIRPIAAAATGVVGEITTGLAYVRARPWLWVTLASAALAYLLFMGPVEVLVPTTAAFLLICWRL